MKHILRLQLFGIFCPIQYKNIIMLNKIINELIGELRA